MQPQQEYFNRAFNHIRSGDAEAALLVCLGGLADFPEDPNILCLTARALIALKRLGEARIHIEKAKSLQPEFSMAHESSADLLLVEGRFSEAIESYRRAIQLDPGRSDLHLKIARTRDLLSSHTAFATGNKSPIRKRRDMGFADEITQAGKFERNGEPDKAENIYRDILKRDPNHIEAIRLLAAVACTHRHFRDAEVLLLQAVSLAPDFAKAWLDLSNVQGELDKFPESIESAREVEKLAPQTAESYIALANALARAGQQEEAITGYQQALKIKPSHPGAFSGLGHQLKTVGRQQESIEVYRQYIAANPRNTEPYWSLANMKTFRFEDAEVGSMEELLGDDSLDDLSVEQLCNALGLEYEGRGDYDQAFDYFQRCSDKRRESENYDPVANETVTDKLIEIFNEAFLSERQGNGVADASPILIIGLPRSGSTLIEQILASHSQVEGTHELTDMPFVIQSIGRSSPQMDQFPDFLTTLGKQAWSKIGRQYLERTKKHRSGVARFIDKNPNNFLYVGLIHLAMPHVKIINSRRHPLDSCFGSYKQLFASGQPFSYDLTELGEYYIQYQRLMDHWHQTMPGKVLDVDYEEVVQDLDTQVRRLLDYCELPVEDACFRFHETERAVKTASSEQVRQPIYTSSVNLWRNYEPHLDELIEALDPILRMRPEADWPRRWQLSPGRSNPES
ncbi:MAG TPA: sulfotransferase [Pseudomonadales bacterium]|nr:sulfotransferase [Pseudomonadales bacterium]MDP6317166.1 sulfotransferase [Pseudomonadales bacterium]HJP49747.1 sulfotransferase [Pseudomonadales bacterium]